MSTTDHTDYDPQPRRVYLLTDVAASEARYALAERIDLLGDEAHDEYTDGLEAAAAEAAAAIEQMEPVGADRVARAQEVMRGDWDADGTAVACIPSWIAAELLERLGWQKLYIVTGDSRHRGWVAPGFTAEDFARTRYRDVYDSASEALSAALVAAAL